MKTIERVYVSQEVLPLLGAALLAVQKVEWTLFCALQPLCKQCHSKDIRALGRMTSSQFLKGTIAELQPTLLSLEEALADNLPMPVEGILELIYKRNLITHHFWELTDAEIKGAEKISQPVSFLQDLLVQCDGWMEQIECVS